MLLTDPSVLYNTDTTLTDQGVYITIPVSTSREAELLSFRSYLITASHTRRRMFCFVDWLRRAPREGMRTNTLREYKKRRRPSEATPAALLAAAARKATLAANYSKKKKMMLQLSSAVVHRHRLVLLCSVLCGLLVSHCSNAETLEAGSRCGDVPGTTCGEGLVCVPETRGSAIRICRGN